MLAALPGGRRCGQVAAFQGGHGALLGRREARRPDVSALRCKPESPRAASPRSPAPAAAPAKTKTRWRVTARHAYNVSATAANIVTRAATKSAVQREFNTEISRLGKAGQWQHALEMLQTMQSTGVPPTRVSYNAALSALTKNAQWELGLDMFEETFRGEDVGIEPDSFSYAAALSACAQTLQWERALTLFREMEAAGIEPNVFTYSSLLAACERSNQPGKAAEIFEEMQARGARAWILAHAYQDKMRGCAYAPAALLNGRA
jgi:pentatricopeptide repeat protein